MHEMAPLDRHESVRFHLLPQVDVALSHNNESRAIENDLVGSQSFKWRQGWREGGGALFWFPRVSPPLTVSLSLFKAYSYSSAWMLSVECIMLYFSSLSSSSRCSRFIISSRHTQKAEWHFHFNVWTPETAAGGVGSGSGGGGRLRVLISVI